jgi:hypothetical protein
MVIVGYVEYAHQNNGKIFVKVDNGYELDELHNVKITDPLNNQALIFDSSDSVWKNESIASAIGYTPVPTTRTISTTAPLTGGGDLSADRTLSMPAATTSANGYLTSTDWNTFNNKENFLASGTTAQYYRGDKTFQTLDTLAVAENTNLYYTQARFDTAFGNKSTTNLTEGTNLYYTDARARAAISGTLPISVTSGVVSISQAGGASNGYLSSTDWNTFNNKQAALNGTGFVKISGTTISYDNNTYLTTISGIAAGGELSGTYANPSLVNSAVTGKVLTGLNLTGGGTIADTDSILGAFGKVQNQISALVGGVMYEGTWNASTNTPTIVSSVGSKGDYYIVATAGSTNINGITSWNVGDWIIFNGSTWDKVDNTDAVSSVNGYTGAVSLVTNDIAESGSLYFTNARAIGSTLTGYTSGAGVVAATDTILQAIQKLNGNVSGLVTGVSSVFGRTGAVIAASGDYTTTQVTEGTNLYYTEARVSANTDVAANTAARHAAVTIGTANGLSLSTQALSLAAANTSTTGALTSTDWNTFNGKQAALNGTGFVKISGTTISYDNSTYLTTSAASSTYLPLAGGTLTGPLNGTSVSLGSTLTALQGIFINSGVPAIQAIRNLNVVSVGTAGQGIEFGALNGSTPTAGAAIYGSLDNPATTGALVFQTLTAGSLTTKLTIASTGAATFLTSVTAASMTIGSVGSGSNAVLTLANNASGSPRTIYYKASDATINITGTGGTDLMTITNGGNVSIGSTNTTARFNIQASSNFETATLGTATGTMGYLSANGLYGMYVGIGNSGNTWLQSQRNDGGTTPYNLLLNPQGGNVGIGTTSIGNGTSYGGGGQVNRLKVASGNYTCLEINGNTSGGSIQFTYGVDAPNQVAALIAYNYASGSVNEMNIINGLGGAMTFGTSNIERMRFKSDGFLKAKGNAANYISLNNSSHEISTNQSSNYNTFLVSQTASDPYGLYIWYSGASPNNSANEFLACADGTNVKAYIFSNGNLANRNGTYGTISSDIRLKENIVPATSKLEDLLKLNVVNFNLKDDQDKKKQLGFIAQEFKQVFPSLVYEKDTREYDEQGNLISGLEDTLGIQVGMEFAILVKAIQELEARVKELENK